MSIECDHPRPALNLPGYVPPRMAWQVPSYIPELAPSAARVIREALQGVYQELSRLGQTRNLIPLQEDLEVRPGSVVSGVGDGQTITLLPPGADGYLDPVSILLTDVENPVTVLHPDGTVTTLGEPGAYDFMPAGEDAYETNPGGLILSGGIPTDRLIGRDSAGTGALEFIALLAPLEFDGSQNIRIAADGISNTLLRNSAALSVIGRSANSTGDPADIAGTASSDAVLRVSGTTLGFGQVATAGIADAAVTLAKMANLTAGTVIGRQIDATTGVPVALSGLEQAENWRRGTIQTVSGVSGTLDIQLNDDTTVLLIRTTGDATLRTLETSTVSDAGREVVIEHDRLSGSGTLTIAHNTAGTYSAFFNPDTAPLYLGQTTCCTVRFRSGFWRPQGTASGGFVFPGSPIYDVMRPPFNATGNGVADDTAAINAAIAAANAVPGDIYLGDAHLVTGALTAITGDAIFIKGRGCRGDGTLITLSGSTPFTVFTFDTCRDCGIEDVFILGPGTWASRGLGIFIDDAFRTRVERVEINGTYGAIEIYASVITQIVDTYASAILGPYAFYAYGSAADGENHALQFMQCATGTDVTGGTIAWYKQGSGSHTFELINCGALEGGRGLYVTDDTPYTGSTPLFTRTVNFQADHCAEAGIYLENGATANFTHTFITSTSAGNAFHVASTYSGNWEMNGGMLHATAGHGAFIACDHWSMTGVQIGNIDAGFDMVHIDAGVTDFSITGCTLGDIFGNGSVANYGINIAATCDRYTIVGNRIIGNNTGAINDGPGPATSRIIQGNNPTSVNTVRIDEIETMAVGTVVGRRVDAGSTGRPVALTGAEVSELWRRSTIQTVSGVSGTLDILLNDDTTVLLIRTTGDATLRSLGDGLATAGREVVIEHDRLSGSGNLTVQHNTVGTYSAFFNPDVTDIVLGQTTCTTVRLRSGFWRPQTNSGRVRAADYGDITVSAGGATWTIDNNVVSDAKLRDSDACSVIGRSANSSGDPADISAGTNNHFLRRVSNVLGFGDPASTSIINNGGSLERAALTGDVTAAQNSNATTIANAAVSNAKLANMAAARVKGVQVDGSTGAPQDLTGAEVGELIRRNTRQTVSAASGTIDVDLNDDCVVLTIQSTADVTLRSMNDTSGGGDGRCILIEHERSSGTGNLTIQHNGATPTYTPFFNQHAADLTIGQTEIIEARTRSGFWRPIGPVRRASTSVVLNGTSFERAALTGDVTAAQNSNATTIANDAVGDAKLRNSAALSVIGRSANSTGDPADIAAANDGEVLRRSGTTLGFGTVVAAGLASDAVTTAKILDANVTLAKMANLAQSSIIGRAESAGTGVPQALTSTQVAAIIDGEPISWTNDHAFTGTSTRVTGMFRFDGINTTASTAANNLAIGNINVLRSTGPLSPLTGMVPGGDGQIVLLVNAHASTDMVVQLESPSSTAANRFAGSVTDRHIKPGEMALAWYDGTADRWILLCRDDVDL